MQNVFMMNWKLVIKIQRFLLFRTSVLKIQTRFSKIMPKSSNHNQQDNANGHLLFVCYKERKCYCWNSQLHKDHKIYLSKHYPCWYAAISHWEISRNVCILCESNESINIFFTTNLVHVGSIMLQAGRLRVWFPMKSSDFSIDLILSAALRSWGQLSH
jgi:hypothetical protein